MMLMPTSCWKTASPIPIQTTGASRRVPSMIKSDKRGRRSPRRLCTTCRTSASASPPMLAKTRRASSSPPRATRKRGDSGMSHTPARNAIDGTASIQNIQRQAGAPSQKVALAPPATRTMMSLLKKAPNSPDTIAICCREASRPRMCGGATSAIYIGASTLAAPMARPPRSREAMNTPAELARPGAAALMRNRAAFSNIGGRRPYRSATVPATKAPTAHPSRTDATAKPVVAARVPKAWASASTVPLTTPLSNPKRKPPSAATELSAMTYAELSGVPRIVVAPVGGRTRPVTSASMLLTGSFKATLLLGHWGRCAISEVDPSFESDHKGVGDLAGAARPDDVLEVGREVDRVLEESEPIGQLERGLVLLDSDGRIRLPRAPLRVFQVFAESTVHDTEAYDVGRPRREHAARDHAGGEEEGHHTD